MRGGKNMDRRLILAITLSLLVMLSWSVVMSKFYPTDNKRVTEKLPSKVLAVSVQPSKPTLASEEPQTSFKLSQEKCEITFVEPLAAIKEVIFKDYQLYKFPLQYALLLGDKSLLYKKESIADNQVTFVSRDKDKQIIKRFIIPNSNYTIDLEIEIQNVSTVPINIDLPLILGVLNFTREQTQARFQDVTVALKDKNLHRDGRKEEFFAGVKFLGLRDRYFCAIIQPYPDSHSAFIQKINPQESEIGLNLKGLKLDPGQQIKQNFHIYLGPQELRLITRVNPDWSAVIYYGTFDFIGQLLLQTLEFLYGIVHNWGLVIVILSIAIYLILFPLTLKQMRSMKQMQVLQPAIEELRKAYKDNPQKLNKEVMELYRQHKVNPLSGCLPIILQIPIFFALYQVLIRSVALKGARFLWIKDLSEPDRLFILPMSLPVLGNEINLLPILMTIGMFVQQKISMKVTSGGSKEQQKLMLIIFPLMFGFIFYRMPAGLVLYWFLNSSLMLIYQFRINRTK